MPEETPGNLYVFEGMDGVGKSTVAQKFADQIDAAYLETPGAGVQEIREYVDSQMHDRQTKFLMYLASNSAIADQVEPQLEAGNDIVLDRYYPTTIVYNEAAEEENPEKWRELAEEFDFLEPDHIFYLWTDEETRKERMYSRDEVGHRNETNDTFMAQVREEYDKAVEEFDMTRIEAVDGVENVLDQIFEEVNQ
jgi:dTMP kinase